MKPLYIVMQLRSKVQVLSSNSETTNSQISTSGIIFSLVLNVYGHILMKLIKLVTTRST